MIKRLGSKIKLFVFTILILIITIEMLSFIATKLNLLMVNEELDVAGSVGSVITASKII